MAKITLTDVSAGYLSIATYNANNTLLEAAIENTLSRDGTTPNTMSASLDYNSNKATNMADGTNQQDGITLAQLQAASVVSNSTTAANVTVADAGGYYVGDSAEACLQELWVTLASVSTGDGAALIGVEDSAANWTGTDVEAVMIEMQVEIDAISGLSNVVDDTTPQLGGALDANGKVINMADFAINRPVLTDYGITSTTNTVSGNAVTFDLTTGNSFELDMEAATGTVTVTVSNPPASGTYGECIIKIQQDTTSGRAVTWPAAVVWPAGTAPVISTGADEIDIVSLKTWDGGTIWYGSYSQDYS